MKVRDWEGEIKDLLVTIVTKFIYNQYLIIDG